MRRAVLSFFVIMCSTPLFAAEPIPRADFLSITDKVLDALDEVEAVFSRSDSTKKEARDVLNRLEVVKKKYDRYKSGKWPEGRQQEIVGKIEEARLEYEIYMFSSGAAEDMKAKAEEAARTARALFGKYKKSGK